MSRYYYNRRRSRSSSPRTKIVPGKPISVSTLARREKRLVNLISRLDQLSNDPAYLAEESLRISRIAQIEVASKELSASKYAFEKEASTEALVKISAIYAHAAKTFVDNRSWWQRFTDPIVDFKYSLPSTYGTRVEPRFSPIGGRYGNSYGCFRQSVETWRKVCLVEDHYLDVCKNYSEDISNKLDALASERSELAPRKICHKTPSQLAALRIELNSCRQLLADAMLDEDRLRNLYGVDDVTIGKAAAFDEQTRKLAEKLRPQLFSQLKHSEDCPYCGGTLGGTPNADHIVPVSLGGLSTASNLVFVCATCNNKKSNLTLREFCIMYSLDRDTIERVLATLGKRV